MRFEPPSVYVCMCMFVTVILITVVSNTSLCNCVFQRTRETMRT